MRAKKPASAARAGFLCLAVVVSAAARAQTPEDDWSSLPDAGAPAAPVEVTPLPPPMPMEAPPPPLVAPPPAVAPSAREPMPTREQVLARVRPAAEANRVSVFGAPTLGAGKRGQAIAVGFPLINVRVLFGLGDRVDLGVGYDTYYFLMNEPMLVARFGLVAGQHWSLGVTVDGGYAFFSQRASRETRGARWLTGRRNINASAAVLTSYQGDGPRAARLFFELRYLLAFDLEPYATDPLVGVPPGVVLGHNVTVGGGAELPLSSKTSFVFTLGLMIHGREIDSVVMPQAAVGLVTGL